jgi:hypothetical protein
VTKHGCWPGTTRSSPQRSLAHWQWKFRDNPTGQVHTMVAEHETDGIVGAYVTLPERVVEGKQCLAGQCVDLWVLPKHRRARPRPGLFVNLGSPTTSAGAATAGPELVPLRLADRDLAHRQKYLRYEMRARLGLPVPRSASGGLPRARVPANWRCARSHASTDTDALWASLAKTTRLSIVRDAKYLNWRFADAHDALRTAANAANADGQTARHRRAGAPRLRVPNTCFLVDWLVPADDYDATTRCSPTPNGAPTRKARVLATLFQHRDPRFLHFQQLGFTVYGTELLPGRDPVRRARPRFYAITGTTRSATRTSSDRPARRQRRAPRTISCRRRRRAAAYREHHPTTGGPRTW